MKIVGYVDHLSAVPGETVTFMVSSQSKTFEAAIVRMIHGDRNPAGPGFKVEPVDSELTGTYQGRPQVLRPGSFVRIKHDGQLDMGGSFTMHLWIWPTMSDKEVQTLISRVSECGSGYALRIASGRLSLHRDGQAEPLVTLDRAVQRKTWYSVAVVYDAAAEEARLRLQPVSLTASELADSAHVTVLKAGLLASGGDVLIAAEEVREGDERIVSNFYNGKIDSPTVFNRALTDDELSVLEAGGAVSGDVVAAWDFSADISSSAVTDISASGLHGRTVQKPTRGMTGWNWNTSETAWKHAPAQYGAIHFHDDDLEDPAWEPSMKWTVPYDLPSGIYAAHLQAEGEEDHVPFIVIPKRGRTKATIALLAPTFSYLAYGNNQVELAGMSAGFSGLGAGGSMQTAYPSTKHDKYIVENRLRSLYNLHSDGSVVAYSSWKRPVLTMRPDYRAPLLDKGEGSPKQLGADLHLVDWLHEQGYEFDVITDDALHAQGAVLLEPYRVVLTGSHCEYWSHEMIRATQDYLSAGGRLMYLAGNGMDCVAQLDPENGQSVEIRRGPVSHWYDTQPGEAHLSSTGEFGGAGAWKSRGIPAHSWLGIGFTAASTDNGRPYKRQPDSFTPQASWVFEGMRDDELIGDTPALVNSYGAAGFEIDCADYELGSPARTLILATATGFSSFWNYYEGGVWRAPTGDGGILPPHVRADITLLEYPDGGAVFSTGSITWSSCLSYNRYSNAVSLVTRNVLDRFASEDRGSVVAPVTRTDVIK
ncbi:N,N-dimethylformamidase beta subunit family domain-containing protein [Mesorhizobium sp. M1252]|uniref:N,N-dimethylformamidase beta subunit family domain-containing protein n=1 Tax=Mesorhizobium sp. M1252 TaxID=2957073 RepID=UPI00333E0914